MTDAANPLDNKEAIAQMGQELRNSMNFLLSEFMRPALQQSKANADAIAVERELVRDLRESVEILRDSSDDTAGEAVELEHSSSRQDASITNLIENANADRAENARRFDAMMQRLDRTLNALESISDRVATLEQRAS